MGEGDGDIIRTILETKRGIVEPKLKKENILHLKIIEVKHRSPSSHQKMRTLRSMLLCVCVFVFVLRS